MTLSNNPIKREIQLKNLEKGIKYRFKKGCKMWKLRKKDYNGKNNPFYGKQHTEEVLKRISKTWIKKGNEHPNWNGGRTKENKKRINKLEWRKIRKDVYKRDNWNCKNCGKHGGRLISHHKIPYRVSKDNSLDNLITLCQKCHAKIENNLIGERV